LEIGRIERRKGREFLIYRVRIGMEFRIKIKILSISSVETGVPEEKTLQAKLQTTETNRDQCHKNSHGCKLQIFVIS
jgi:hypothetical protein